MFTPVRAITAAAVAALATAVAVPALTTAQTSGTRDITVRERVQGVKMIDTSPRSRHERFSRGDRVVTEQALFSESGNRVGTLFTDCVGVGRTAQLFKATLLCSSTYRFRDGDVMTAAAVELAPGARGAIVGGTGAYKGVRGEGEAAPPVKGYDSVDVLHLEG
ncbi:MAG: allene oxide cyclase barrel-like domain-containing protein [Thermoleophilaceae bacterium]